MTVTLPPDIEQGLLAEARSRGVSLDTLLEELLRQHVATAVRSSPSNNGGTMVKLDDGMWALRSGDPMPANSIDDMIDAVRRDRDLGNLGL